jgi:hypothetical protein
VTLRKTYDIESLKKHKQHDTKFVVSVNKQLSLAEMELYIDAVSGVATVPLNWVNIASSHKG